MACEPSRKKFKSGWCSAVTCTNASSKECCAGKSYFRFPKDTDRCKKWIQNCGRQDLHNMSSLQLSTSCNRLCSDHFEESQYKTGKRKQLIYNAVPTVFTVPNPPPALACKGPALKPRGESTLQRRPVFGDSVEIPPLLLNHTLQKSMVTQEKSTSLLPASLKTIANGTSTISRGVAESDEGTGQPTQPSLLKSKKRKITYANICIVPGCTIKQSDKAYSFHKFPKNPELRKKWIKFVSTAGLVSFRFPTSYTTICSGHFEPDCFPYSFWLKKSMGLRTCRVLKPGSLPTILNSDDGPFMLAPKGVKKVRGAYQKREHRRVIDALLADCQKDVSKRGVSTKDVSTKNVSAKDLSWTDTVIGNTYTNIPAADGISLIYVQPKWHEKYFADKQPQKMICNKSISTLSSHNVLTKKALQTVSRYQEEFCPLVLEVENTEKEAAQLFEVQLERTEEAMDHAKNPEPEMAVKPEPEMDVQQEPETEVKQESETEAKQEPKIAVNKNRHWNPRKQDTPLNGQGDII